MRIWDLAAVVLLAWALIGLVQAEEPDEAPDETIVEEACPYPTLIANPWCFNFVGGDPILSPPVDFCRYFECIERFPDGWGYVVQCRDLSFSKMGGIRGSCSEQGGSYRPLLAP